nr:RNA-directed DNA polymerase, eukaryota [Tanacetum cinerariifolium]
MQIKSHKTINFIIEIKTKPTGGVPRLYALESHKRIDVAAKLAHYSVAYSFRRAPRSGEEQFQLADLLTTIEGVSLVSMNDRWVWSWEGSGNFFVASVRKLIDDRRLPDVSSKTRWIKAVPIKVNVHAWKVRLDSLPTRLNISRRGIDIASIFCSICGNALESSRRLFFDCHVAKDLFRNISRWWDLSYMEVSSYDEWTSYILTMSIVEKADDDVVIVGLEGITLEEGEKILSLMEKHLRLGVSLVRFGAVFY